MSRERATRKGVTVYCPYCNGPSDVIDSRRTDDNRVRRRRECFKCDKRWTTFEYHDEEIAAMQKSHVTLHKVARYLKGAVSTGRTKVEYEDL